MSTARYWAFSVVFGALVLFFVICREVGWSDWEPVCLVLLVTSVPSLLIRIAHIEGSPVTLDRLKLRKPYILLAVLDTPQEEFRALILIRDLDNCEKRIVVALTEKLSNVPVGRLFVVVPHFDEMRRRVKGILDVVFEGGADCRPMALAIRPPKKKS